jgi:hypothetical protein
LGAWELEFAEFLVVDEAMQPGAFAAVFDGEREEEGPGYGDEQAKASEWDE